MRTASENIVLLPSGCVCCQVAGDLVQALRDLYFKRAAGEVPAFRRAIIETTGLADPAPLARTLVELPLVAARYSLSGVVTTVDGEHGLAQLERHPEAVKQAAVADRLVVTKADLAAPRGARRARGAAARAQPGRADHAQRPWRRRPASGCSTPASTAAAAASRTRALAERRRLPPGGRAAPAAHDPRMQRFAWFAERPVAWPAFEDALATLLELAGDRILRLKGLVNVAGEHGPVAVHAVQHTLYPPATPAAWPDADRRTRLVFIVARP